MAFSDVLRMALNHIPVPNLGIFLLADIAEHPDDSVALRYRQLNISVRQGQRLTRELLRLGFIEQDMQRTQNGRLKVIRLTEKGEEFLREAQKS